MPNEFKIKNGLVVEQGPSQITGSLLISGSLVTTQGITGSLLGTSSFAQTASFVPGGVTGTGANGQVAFWNGTNSQTGDNGLFWDNTNKRLGVGTNTPSGSLHIKGISELVTDLSLRVETSLSRMLLQVNNLGVTRVSGPQAQLLVGVESGGLPSNFVLRGNATISNTGTNNVGAVEFDQGSTSTSSRIRQYDGVGSIKNVLSANGITYFTGGNVGIGATTAGARLDVRAQGALSTDIAFRVRNSADTFDVININGSQTTIINNDISSSTLRIRNNAGGRVLELLDFNGNAFQWLDQSGARLVDVSGNYFIARSQGTAASPSYTISGLGGIGGANGMMMFAMGGNRRMFLTTSGQLRIPASNDFGQDLPHPSAKLQLDATTQGFLPPRMTNAQRLAIASPAVGLMVYCTDTTEGLYINKSTGWTFII